MPSGMNSFNQMEHAQAQARKAMEAAQQAQNPQGGMNNAQIAAQQANTQQVDPAAAVPMQQAGIAPGMQGMAPQQPQEGPEDLIDSVQNGTATDMNGKPFANTLKSAKQAFAQMLAQAESGNTPEATPSMQNNPAVSDVTQPEAIAPGEGIPAEPQEPLTAPAPQRSVEEIVQDAVQRILQGNEGQTQSEPQSAENAPENPADEIKIPDINSDEFYEKFTENPGEAINMVADAIAEQKLRDFKAQIQPLIDQSDQLREQKRATDAIRQFAENGYGDFNDYKDDIISFMQDRQLPIDDPTAYENAYNFAKARRLQAQNDELKANQSRTLDDYLNDADSKSRMAADEQVKRMVIEQYLKSLQDGQSPQVITGGSGDSPSATPRNRVNSIREAGRLFSQSLNQ